MIFATVGTQLPFPRFVDALDAIAARHDLAIVAQTCEATCGRHHLEEHAFMPPESFDGFASAAAIIVGHAGIGTVVAAKRHAKPLILFPRRAALGEHRNDHQMATAKALSERTGIHIAYDEADLESLIQRREELPPISSDRGDHASMLIERLSELLGSPR